MTFTLDDSGRPLALVTADLRTALTPVLGYLDLILEAGAERPTEQQLRWIGSVERQLRATLNLSGELVELCEGWRAAGRATAAGRNGDAAEAPQPGAVRHAAG